MKYPFKRNVKRTPCVAFFERLLFNPYLGPLSQSFIPTVKFSDIRRTLEDNQIVDHLDVFGASPVGAAPTTSSFFT